VKIERLAKKTSPQGIALQKEEIFSYNGAKTRGLVVIEQNTDAKTRGLVVIEQNTEAWLKNLLFRLRKLFIDIIGNATSLALYSSPMSTFWRIYKFKSTKEYSGPPYVFTLFNCCVGLLYGSPFVKPHSTMILTINSAD